VSFPSTLTGHIASAGLIPEARPVTTAPSRCPFQLLSLMQHNEMMLPFQCISHVYVKYEINKLLSSDVYNVSYSYSFRTSEWCLYGNYRLSQKSVVITLVVYKETHCNTSKIALLTANTYFTDSHTLMCDGSMWCLYCRTWNTILVTSEITTILLGHPVLTECQFLNDRHTQRSGLVDSFIFGTTLVQILDRSCWQRR
jgi:hypothetical protein